jgi:hypothetical protein
MTLARADFPPLHRRLPGARLLRDGSVLYWWGELLFVLSFYVVYSTIRNLNEGSPAVARANAYRLMGWQAALGIDWEAAIHRWALERHALILAANYFYGSLHFVVTAGVLIFLYRSHDEDYPRLRNTIAIATGLALVGFAFWPLMPPRLLPASFGFVDTLDVYPTFWSFQRGAVNRISNQYAAMPSVHCVWALWCAGALVPRVESASARLLAILYPAGTVVSIVVTSNHFLLDAVAGYLVLALAWPLARALTRAGRTGPPSAAACRRIEATPPP